MPVPSTALDWTSLLEIRWAPGFNCWDMVRLVQKNWFGIELPDFRVTVFNHLATWDFLEEQSVSDQWREIQIPAFGDVVSFFSPRRHVHVGVILQDGRRMIHLPRSSSTRIEDHRALAVSYKSTRFHRHASRHHN